MLVSSSTKRLLILFSSGFVSRCICEKESTQAYILGENLICLRYTHRPSREEDIERITSLEEAAVEQENLVARTLEEMAFFKRELLNREENYNKKFNASPIVGVMQVRTPLLLSIMRVIMLSPARPLDNVYKFKSIPLI